MDKSQNKFLTQSIENGVIVLTFTEPTLNADAVTEASTVINAAENRKVILNLQYVRFFVSNSLFPEQGTGPPLVRLGVQLNEKGVRLVLCNVSPELAELFRITRLDRILKISPNVALAVACMEDEN
jgi:anti-anti-sigma factor